MHEEQEVLKTSGEKYIIFLFLLKTWLSSMNIVTAVASYTFRNKEPVTLLRTVIFYTSSINCPRMCKLQLVANSCYFDQ